MITFKNDNHQDRFEVLQAMHTLAIHFNDERFYMEWIELVPDGATDEDLMDVAEDITLFRDATNLFCKRFNYYVRKNGGLYIGGEVYGEA